MATARHAKKGTVRKSNKRTRLLTVLFVLLFVFGAFLALYPFVSDLFVSKQQAQAIADYQSYINSLDRQIVDDQFEKAQQYNSQNNTDGYEDALNLGESMCVVEIPSIGVELPVYHGVSAEVLDFALGHVENSSLPVGGEGTHCIITGHTGLASVRILDDLINVKMGEVFYIRVLGRTLEYKVDQIKVIEPTDMTYLQPEAGKDYVTLLTCTPYGINSHRLIVRGTRVGTHDIQEDESETATATDITPATETVTDTEEPDLTNAPRRSMVNIIWIISIISFMLSLIVLIIIIPKPKRRKSAEPKKSESDEI